MPPAELAQLIVNGSPAVSIVALFLWYLTKIGKIQERKDEQTIRALSGVAQKMGFVEKKVDDIRKDHKEDKEIIKKMYTHSLTLAKKAGVYMEG